MIERKDRSGYADVAHPSPLIVHHSWPLAGRSVARGELATANNNISCAINSPVLKYS